MCAGMLIGSSDSSSEAWEEVDEFKARPSYTERSHFKEAQSFLPLNFLYV